jgi:hypothetical protein
MEIRIYCPPVPRVATVITCTPLSINRKASPRSAIAIAIAIAHGRTQMTPRQSTAARSARLWRRPGKDFLRGSCICLSLVRRWWSHPPPAGCCPEARTTLKPNRRLGRPPYLAQHPCATMLFAYSSVDPAPACSLQPATSLRTCIPLGNMAHTSNAHKCHFDCIKFPCASTVHSI